MGTRDGIGTDGMLGYGNLRIEPPAVIDCSRALVFRPVEAECFSWLKPEQSE
jgi:hypothetical protein